MSSTLDRSERFGGFFKFDALVFLTYITHTILAHVALAKNAQGKLGPAGARYALHRLFRRTRAWLVRGIAPNGLAWNTAP